MIWKGNGDTWVGGKVDRWMENQVPYLAYHLINIGWIKLVNEWLLVVGSAYMYDGRGKKKRWKQRRIKK